MRLLLTAISGIMAISVFAQQPGALKVSSKDFKHNGKMPVKYSCEGDNTNPSLRIDNIPEKAKTLAIIMQDPDAPKQGGFTHWVVWNIPTDKDIPGDYKGGEQGANGTGKNGYFGMCPPSGTHHYLFNVYALDSKLDIDPNTDKAGLETAMRGHILAEGLLTGLYSKQDK